MRSKIYDISKIYVFSNIRNIDILIERNFSLTHLSEELSPEIVEIASIPREFMVTVTQVFFITDYVHRRAAITAFSMQHQNILLQ